MLLAAVLQQLRLVAVLELVDCLCLLKKVAEVYEMQWVRLFSCFSSVIDIISILDMTSLMFS